MKRTMCNKCNGFTLIEILVASGIASIIFAVGYYAVSTTISTTKASTQRIRDTENARLFFMLLERDLLSAQPGPGAMVKAVGDTAGYPTLPSPIVYSDKPTASSAQNEMIQFYAQSDEQGVRDELTFIRYYLNRTQHTICRVSQIYDPTAGVPLPDRNTVNTLNPLDLTIVANDNNALFDNVRRLSIVFKQWDVKEKKYVREGTGNPPAQCDFIEVTVVFTNEFAQGNLDRPNPVKTSNEYKDSLEKTYRAFTRVMPIPPSFKQ